MIISLIHSLSYIIATLIVCLNMFLLARTFGL